MRCVITDRLLRLFSVFFNVNICGARLSQQASLGGFEVNKHISNCQLLLPLHINLGSAARD